MNFITDDDYPTVIKTANLESFTDFHTRSLAEATAIDLVRQYLFQRYDTAAIFAQSGTNRNLALVRICMTIALYLLYQRLPKRQVPEWVENDYNTSLDFLDNVMDGKITMDLPRLTDSAGKPRTKFKAGYNSLRPE